MVPLDWRSYLSISALQTVNLNFLSTTIKQILFLMLRFAFLILLSLSASFSSYAAKVAIIIDDIGYRKSDLNVLSLPGNITYSVLPQTPYGKKLAQKAYDRNLDVMLHIPMEATNGKKLGPGALTSEMGEQAIRNNLAKAFSEVPFAVGINNHMGSLLTQMYSPMAWTMRYLKEENRFFVDSVTTEQSKARLVAKKFGVPALSRHIFLDNHLEHDYINGQFEQLISIAKKYDRAIAIAHPHPETIESLSKLIPLLAQNDIELVGISTLITGKAKQTNIVKAD